jgi:hypothetical protein
VYKDERIGASELYKSNTKPVNLDKGKLIQAIA